MISVALFRPPETGRAPEAPLGLFAGTLTRVHGLFQRIPESLVALLARFSIAAVFWNSGQTKGEGFVANLVSGEFELGLPRLSGSAVDLFRDEHKMPLLPPPSWPPCWRPSPSMRCPCCCCSAWVPGWPPSGCWP